MELNMFDFLNSLFKRPSIRDRRFQRVFVEAQAELYFTERKFSIHGMTIELSCGGALFREASRYILDRRQASVLLRIGRYELPGVIVNVRPSGYGILFDAPISEDVVAEIAGQVADAA
jgi:hypothetical protein